MSEDQSEVVISEKGVRAVSSQEFNKYGCFNCGYQRGKMLKILEHSSIWRCAKCQKDTITLPAGVTKSPFCVKIGNTEIYPELQPHPLKEKVKKDRSGLLFW